MNNTVLRLLQIFENETDADHALTKVEIMEILEHEGYEKINEKQFYRKVDELRENGYDIEVHKGKQTRYFLRKNRLTKEEWIFLLTLILGSKDLSKKETRRIIDCLESMSVCFKSIDYAEDYKDKMSAEKSPFSQLNNFRVILKAIEEKKKISCKQIVDRGNLIFSEEKQIEGLDFGAENNRIIIYGIENGEKVSYLLGDLIDVEII
jgi:predicted DNA-binding transcriptional regulator YafY